MFWSKSNLSLLRVHLTKKKISYVLGNGLVLPGTKPFLVPEPMVTKINNAI